MYPHQLYWISEWEKAKFCLGVGIPLIVLITLFLLPYRP